MAHMQTIIRTHAFFAVNCLNPPHLRLEQADASLSRQASLHDFNQNASLIYRSHSEF